MVLNRQLGVVERGETYEGNKEGKSLKRENRHVMEKRKAWRSKFGICEKASWKWEKAFDGSEKTMEREGKCLKKIQRVAFWIKCTCNKENEKNKKVQYTRVEIRKMGKGRQEDDKKGKARKDRRRRKKGRTGSNKYVEKWLMEMVSDARHNPFLKYIS